MCLEIDPVPVANIRGLSLNLIIRIDEVLLHSLAREERLSRDRVLLCLVRRAVQPTCLRRLLLIRAPSSMSLHRRLAFEVVSGVLALPAILR